MKKISILGSTGSIGTQTLDVVREHGDMQVVALSCGRNLSLIEKQAREFKPQFVSVSDENDAKKLRTSLADTDIEIGYGMDGLIRCATIEPCDIVVTAIVGMLGIRPTIAAIKAKRPSHSQIRRPSLQRAISLSRLRRSMVCPFFRWTVSTVPSSSHCREIL